MASIQDRIIVSSPAPTFELEAPSPHMIMRRRALTHAGFLFGATVVLATVLIAICAPLLTPYDPYAQDLSQRLIPPGSPASSAPASACSAAISAAGSTASSCIWSM